MPWASNIAKTTKSKGKQFTVTREMLIAESESEEWLSLLIFQFKQL